MRSTLFTLALSSTLAGSALAQSEAPAKPAQPAPAETAPPAAKSEVTLIARDGAGALQRLARATEFAALDVLTLSDAERAGAEAILAARARELDAAVKAKPDQLVRVLRVRSEGPTEDVRIAVRDIAKDYPPLRDRQQLAHQLMKALQGDNPKAFSRVLNEYNRAAIAQASADAKAKGFKGDPFAMSSQESGRQAALEVCESFDRQCANVTREQLEAMLATLTLTDDVKGKALKSVETFYASTDAPSRSAFFTELMNGLPMTERIALARLFFEPRTK